MIFIDIVLYMKRKPVCFAIIISLVLALKETTQFSYREFYQPENFTQPFLSEIKCDHTYSVLTKVSLRYIRTSEFKYWATDFLNDRSNIACGNITSTKIVLIIISVPQGLFLFLSCSSFVGKFITNPIPL